MEAPTCCPSILIAFVNIAKDFIRRLLEFDPRRRLSLSAARHHPWLNQSIPTVAGADGLREARETFSSLASFPDSSLTSLPDDDDEAMADAPISEPSMSAGLEQLQLDQSPQRNGGRAPLQRRSQVLANAADNDVDLPEPSWQMLDAAGAAPVRAGKRKLNEHDPQSLSAVMEDGENVTLHKGGARKKGKQTSSDAEDSATGGDVPTPAPPKRGGRGRGRGRGAAQVKARLQEAAAGMVVEEDHMDDETEPPRPRRSSRTSPNKGRKA